jgi:hypothetical protein
MFDRRRTRRSTKPGETAPLDRASGWRFEGFEFEQVTKFDFIVNMKAARRSACAFRMRSWSRPAAFWNECCVRREDRRRDRAPRQDHLRLRFAGLD